MPIYDSMTATPDDVLYPYSFIGKDGVIQSGRKPNLGAIYYVIGAGEEYYIPKGYHNGSGIIEALSLADQTAGNATPDQVVAGKTLWVKGVQITGTLITTTSHSASKLVFNSPLLYIGVPKGARTERAWTITIPNDDMFNALKIDLNTIASGVTVFDKYVGTYTNDADATADDVIEGRTCYVKGVKITGRLTTESLF